MACNWRIRHKLMLGMLLVVSIMGLLLGGTLYGLATYRLAVQRAPKEAEVQLRLGIILGWLGSYRDAIEALLRP